jgi:hypothetical protein
MEPWLIEFIEGFILATIVGIIVAPLAVIVLVLVLPQKKCPECGAPLPKLRRPTNFRQFLRGGWTCRKCGCQVDRRGRKM